MLKIYCFPLAHSSPTKIGFLNVPSKGKFSPALEPLYFFFLPHFKFSHGSFSPFISVSPGMMLKPQNLPWPPYIQQSIHSFSIIPFYSALFSFICIVHTVTLFYRHRLYICLLTLSSKTQCPWIRDFVLPTVLSPVPRIVPAHSTHSTNIYQMKEWINYQEI